MCEVWVYNFTVEDFHTYFVSELGVWVHNTCLVSKGGSKTGTYKELKDAGYKDAHHIIQDAAVRDIDGYNKGSAPAIQLEGPSNQVGTEHYIATTVQRWGGGGTYGQERGIAYMALRKAGFTIEESKAYVRYADNYFMGELGLTLDSPTRIPGNRKGHWYEWYWDSVI